MTTTTTTTTAGAEDMAALERAGLVYLRAVERAKAVGAELDGDDPRLKVDDLRDDTIFKPFEAAMEEMGRAKAVVIDLMHAADLDFVRVGMFGLVCPRHDYLLSLEGDEPGERLFVVRLRAA